jgi:hypothetical protein
MAGNGRFSYQPLSEEYAKQSQPGQLIMNRFDGHISANRNGIIVSKTKEIEDKISDINELKHDVDEQYDVISNLLEDIEKFLAGEFKEAADAVWGAYDMGKRMLRKVEYLKEIDANMRRKIDRIRETIEELKQANELQIKWLDEWEPKTEQAITDVGDMAYVENEFNIATALRQTYA